MGDIPSRDAHTEFQGHLDTYSYEQPEGNLDMVFHSQTPSFQVSYELSSPSYGHPQQVETPTHAIHLDGNGFLMNPSSEQLSTSPSGRPLSSF
jgi:hypothetical protein